MQTPNFYRNESSNAKTNAQRNLMGRTHYVDDDTLRWHKSRIISARRVDNGLLFAIVTSDALDMNNAKRGFRYVIFDLFGTVIDRPKIDDAFTTSARATQAMWSALNAFDAKAHTLAAIERQKANCIHDLDGMAIEVAKLDTFKPEE